MKKNPLVSIAICVLIGISVGSILGALGYYKFIPESIYKIMYNSTQRTCGAIIVVTVDLFCFWGILQPLINKYINKNGGTVIGVIDDVKLITGPDQNYIDEYHKKNVYSCTISYMVKDRKYKKEFPPIVCISQHELSTIKLEKDEYIPIKFFKPMPYLSIIDVEIVKKSVNDLQMKNRKFIITVSLIITTIFVTLLILL